MSELKLPALEPLDQTSQQNQKQKPSEEELALSSAETRARIEARRKSGQGKTYLTVDMEDGTSATIPSEQFQQWSEEQQRIKKEGFKGDPEAMQMLEKKLFSSETKE